jgi:hypothetical protein
VNKGTDYEFKVMNSLKKQLGVNQHKHQPTMTVSQFLNLELPDCLNVLTYDEVAELAARLANPNDEEVNAWFGFTAGWIGFAMRLRSAFEYDQEFGSLIAHSSNPARSEQYLQERAFFGCVTSALSAIESFFLASYCLANPLSREHFRLEVAGDLKKYPKDVAKAYSIYKPDDPFSNKLLEVSGSNEFNALSDLRNSLAHRGILPRAVFLSNCADIPAAIPSNPKALAQDFTHDASLNAETTAQHVRWTGQALSMLTEELLNFLRPQGTP